MKTMIALILWGVFPLICFSQEKAPPAASQASKNLFLDLSAGASFPVGKSYPGMDINGEKSGFATTGFYLQGTFDWMGKRDLGIAFQISYQSNAINSKVVNDTIKGNDFPIGAGNWHNIYLMAGPVFLKSIKKFLVDVKLLGGFIISMSPVFAMTNTETKQKEEKTATGLGLGITTGVAYKLDQHIALKLTLGYMAGYPSVSKQYNAVQVYDSVLQQIIYTAPSEIKISKTVSAFNAGIGILYIF